MEEELKQARTALAQQIRARGKSTLFTDPELLKRINSAAGRKEAADKYAGRVKIVDPVKYAGLSGYRPDKIWVDDAGADAIQYTQSIVPPPPKLDNEWLVRYSAPLVPPAKPKPEATMAEKITAVSDLYAEYDQFKTWLYQMIGDAQDDLSPAFAYSAVKVRFVKLRAAVKWVIDAGALALVKHDTKERLVEFQKWVDGVQPDEPWQVTGKELLVRMSKVIDPYAT